MISKKRLEEIAYGSVRQSEDEGRTMARYILELQKQEPVYRITKRTHNPRLTSWGYERLGDFEDGQHELYAAPVPGRDGIEAAAKWVDQQREAFDNEHGCLDPDTGAFEFSNEAQHDYSFTLYEIAEGIRALHPSTAPVPPVRKSSPNTASEKDLTERLFRLRSKAIEEGNDSISPWDDLVCDVFKAWKCTAPVPPAVPDELFESWFRSVEAGDDEDWQEPKYLSKEWHEYLHRRQLALGAWYACRDAMLQLSGNL